MISRPMLQRQMGYYPSPEREAAKLRSLLVFPEPASVVDPCVGKGIALDLVTKEANLCRFGVELDADRACMANARGIRTLQGNTFDAIAKPESFSLLYLNPPYDSEIGSVGNSRVERPRAHLPLAGDGRCPRDGHTV
jgi:uncharacterized methyltransferase DUF6094